jgi:phosphoribosylformimino-5-aminoimidazole carboxamide ribonucleotide (ProFAR) isomerase
LLLIPALDVSDGELAWVRRGRPVRIDAFGGDPLAAAEAFVASGAVWLHVVDLDLALRGTAGSPALLRRLAALGVDIQASGGLSNRAEIEEALDAGATRAVLSSAALSDRPRVEELLEQYAERLAVGVEADGQVIRPRSRSGIHLPLVATVEWLVEASAARYLHTAVSRVGSLEGPDVEGLATMARLGATPLVASGGVSSPADVDLLRNAEGPPEAVVIGRALYSGAIDLRALIEGNTEDPN